MTPFDSFRSLPYRERISLVLCGMGGALFCWICVALADAAAALIESDGYGDYDGLDALQFNTEFAAADRRLRAALRGSGEEAGRG